MKFAICNETFGDWDHARVCDFAAELGYTGLELAPFTLAPTIGEFTGEQRTDYRRHAEQSGLQIIGLHWLLAKTTGLHINSVDKEVRKRTGEYLAELALAAAEMGGNILVLGSPMQRMLPAGMTTLEADDLFVETLEYCLPTLEQTSVDLCLEPLTPKETDYINTAADAVRIIDRLQHPNLKLHLDVKAMEAESEPAPEVIKANAKYLRHFHANDPNLRGPGMGDVAFGPIFDALQAIDYSGWVSVEVFDYTPDAETIARESIRYMKECV